MMSIKRLVPRNPFFLKCQFARDSHVLQTETTNGGNSTMQPPTKWNAVYLQQIWWIARMNVGSFSLEKGIVQYFVSIVCSTDKLRILDRIFAP